MRSSPLRRRPVSPVVVTVHRDGTVTADCQDLFCPSTSLYRGLKVRLGEKHADRHLKDHHRAVTR